MDERTTVTFDAHRILINGQPTYSGTPAEGVELRLSEFALLQQCDVRC